MGEGQVKKPTLERVRDVRIRYDLRDYIASELRLEVRGSKGRYIQIKCPFHSDNDPSMAVYEQNYYCHGCRAHGDILDWVRRRDGSDFFTALEMLEGVSPDRASAGIRPWAVQSQPEVQSTVGQDRLRGTLTSIVKAGLENMTGSPAATYCHGRGWGRDVQDAYRLGYVDIHSEDLGLFGGKGLLRGDWPTLQERPSVDISPSADSIVRYVRQSRRPGDADPGWRGRSEVHQLPPLRSVSA